MWWPTWLGSTCVIVILGLLGSFWWFQGEAFLSPVVRVPADVLVVEGWISDQGIRAAADEFRAGKYRYIVATGGFSGEEWLEKRVNYAEDAERELLKTGLSPDQVIRADTGPVETQRTFKMATRSREVLHDHGIQAKTVNVFTRGSHGRRSWKVYSKVFSSQSPVGVISWKPPGYESAPWWHSSERAEDMLKESVGYLYETLFSSGRSSRSKPEAVESPTKNAP